MEAKVVDETVIVYKADKSVEINISTKTDSKKSNPNDTSQFEFKEGGWGWIVTAACALCFGFNVGMVNVYSLIYNKFLEEYDEEKHVVSLAAWIGSTSNCIQFCFCCISSMLVDFFSPRIIGVTGGLVSSIGLLSSAFVHDMRLYFLTYGLVFGVGQSLLLAAFLSILPHYFKKRIGLVNGLMTFGGATLTISLPFIISICLKKIGLAKTFYVLTSMSLVTALCGFTFIPVLPENKSKKLCKRIKDSLQLRIFKMQRFLVWIIAAFIGFFGYLIPVLTISHFSTLLFPNQSPAIISSLFGAVSGISGVVFGKVNDLLSISPAYFHVFSFFLCGTIQILLPFANNFVLLCFGISVFGIVDGLFLSFIVPIACEVTKSHKIANQAVGYFFAIISLPVMIGPMVAGYLYELYKSYNLAYYIGGGTCIVASLVLLLFYPKAFISEMCLEIRNKRKINAIQREVPECKKEDVVS